MHIRAGIGLWLLLTLFLALTVYVSAAPDTQGAVPKSNPASNLVVRLVDEKNKPLGRLSMMPATVGYPQADSGGPYQADNQGKVTIESVQPGTRLFVVQPQGPVPTVATLQVPPGGLKTKIQVRNGQSPSGNPDLDIQARAREKDGRRTIDVTLTNNTDQPYALANMDLQLVSDEYRIYLPSNIPLGAAVPAKGAGSYQLALDWQEYLHKGIWVSRRGEAIHEPWPAAPAGPGMGYYRVVVGGNSSLPFELPKLVRTTGSVLDHKGKAVEGARVYLAGNLPLNILNGQPGDGHWFGGKLERFGTFEGSTAVTDSEGHFTLTVVGGDRVVVVAGGLVWLDRLQVGKEQTLQLPEPGKLTIAYDINGAANEGVIRLQLISWDMPDWSGIAGDERYVQCKNGGTVEIDGLEPGEYDVFRFIEGLRSGNRGATAFCDRGTLKIDAGKAAKLDFVRSRGSSISGKVLGLKEAKCDGAMIHVRQEQATGMWWADDEWKLMVFDAQVTDADGQFKTSRLAPGTYTLTAEAYAPEPEGEWHSGISLPSVMGKAKVVVPENGPVSPIKIQLTPLAAEAPAAPATAPVEKAPQPQATQPAADKPVADKADQSVVAVIEVSRQSGLVDFTMKLTDASGKNVPFPDGDKEPPPPKFQVFAADGKMVYQGTLGYG